MVADPLEAAGDDEHPEAPLALVLAQLQDVLDARRFARSISSSRSTSASAAAGPEPERVEATRVISSARTPISAMLATIRGSRDPVAASFVSLATVTQ